MVTGRESLGTGKIYLYIDKLNRGECAWEPLHDHGHLVNIV